MLVTQDPNRKWELVDIPKGTYDFIGHAFGEQSLRLAAG